MKRKLISLLLALSMTVSVLSAFTVFADGEDGVSPYVEGEETAAEPVGSGTAADPYRIYTKEQLGAYAAKLSTNPASSAKLMNDIVFNEGFEFECDVDTGLIKVSRGELEAYLGTGVKGYGNGAVTQFDSKASEIGAWYSYDGEKYVTATAPFAPEQYAPMASASVPFVGTFDGAGFAIEGAWCTERDAYIGVFAYLGAGAAVKNLTVRNSLFMTKSEAYAGGIAGYMFVKSTVQSLISGCENDGTAVVAKSNAAGILGYQNADANMQGYPLVRDCVNSGDVMSRDGNAAGIMGGSTRGSVSASEFGKTANRGTIYAVGDYAAGITTSLVNGNSITNCFNSGNIYAKRYAAGIAAQSNRAVTKCVNVGNVTAVTYASGVVTRHSESNQVQYCANLGTVSADTYAAGITVGLHNNQRAPQISYCYNAGEVVAIVRAAGIVCMAEYMEWTVSTDGTDTLKTLSTTIKNCFSTDTVRATEIDADPICPYFDEKAQSPSGCEIITEHEVKSGALAYRFSEVMRQNLREDAYPTPTSNENYVIYRGTSYDGYTVYSNQKTISHRNHVNEDGDCYCDECEYTYAEKHINEDEDCYCDICGASDAVSHSFTSGGLCRICGDMKDGISALCYANLSISSGIRLGLFVKLSYAVSISTSAYAEITLDKTKIEIPVSKASRSGEYFVFYVDVPAKYIGTDITIQICGTESGKGEKYSYSVKKYLDKLDLESPSLADLAEAIRLWGGAAQETSGTNGDDLLSGGLSYPSSDEIISDIPLDKTYVTSGTIDGMTLYGKPSITLSDSFTVRFTFEGVDGVKFYYGGHELPLITRPLGRFAVDVNGIPTTEIASDITLIARRGDETFTVSYSILDEIVKNYKGGNKSDAYLKLFYSVLNYAECLKEISGGEIKLNMNGGEISNDRIGFDGSCDVALPTEGMSCTVNGNEQRFLGWYTDLTFRDQITFIPAGTVGTVNVYAKWDYDFFSNKYENDFVIDSDGEIFTDGYAEYSFPAASGARFEVKDGKLVWSATASASAFKAISSVGAMADNLTVDGFISYAISIADVAMDARFGLSVGSSLFEFFRTTSDGKVLFGDYEVAPDESGRFDLYIVLTLANSSVTLYGKDERELSRHRLSVSYNSSMNILIKSSVKDIGDSALNVISDSAGALAIDSIDVLRGHIFKKNGIEYNLDGATVIDDANIPYTYNSTGEATKLPSGEWLYKANHFFGGWYADAGFTLPIDEISIYSVGIVPVYAKWNMIFLDVDYDREDAVDPDMFETTGAKGGNGMSYGISGGKGSYKVLTDDNGEKYLLAATEKNGTQITANATNKFANITSSDLSISFVITFGANGYDYIRRRDGNDETVEYTNIIDESNFTNTYLRLRSGGTDLLYVFNVSADGKVTMGGEEIARIDVDSSEPITLRIVADFKNGNLINYDEDGNVLKTVKFALKNATTYEQMLKLLTGECFCMRLNTDNSAFRLYDVKIVESNVLGKQ